MKIKLPEKKGASSGIEIEYIKSRDVLRIGGFYDGGWGGIETTEITFTDFCKKLGIKPILRRTR